MSDANEYLGRMWVTRVGIKVDRMTSAWLIKRFIDPNARFKFVPAPGYRPERDELRFDMPEAEFTHEGDLCTFEVLIDGFALAHDPALVPLREMVHDLDVKDGKHARAETPAFERLMADIMAAHAADEARLAHASVALDELYDSYVHRG